MGQQIIVECSRSRSRSRNELGESVYPQRHLNAHKTAHNCVICVDTERYRHGVDFFHSHWHWASASGRSQHMHDEFHGIEGLEER